MLYSLILICYLKYGGGNVFLAFYAISNISRKKKILGIKNILFRNSFFSSCFFLMLDPDLFPTFQKSLFFSRQLESISNIYIKQIVVLACEPVSGRSRATELPGFIRFLHAVGLVKTSLDLV